MHWTMNRAYDAEEAWICSRWEGLAVLMEKALRNRDGLLAGMGGSISAWEMD